MKKTDTKLLVYMCILFQRDCLVCLICETCKFLLHCGTISPSYWLNLVEEFDLWLQNTFHSYLYLLWCETSF